MEILTPDELKEKYTDPWITPYHEILTVTDTDEEKIELIEYHPCPIGSDWMITQYKQTSPLITDAKRDGNKHTYYVNKGKTELNLKPSYQAAGIQEASIEEDEIRIVHAGLAGAGVGAAFCRGKADGVIRIELLDKGGGSKVGRAAIITPKLKKVIIGLDDTDIPTEGATWTLANNIANEIQEEKGYHYLEHITCQLYPNNPNKTKNCVSIILVFAVKEEEKEDLISSVKSKLKEKTLSENTAFVVYEKLEIPEAVQQYGLEAKKSMKYLDEAKRIAEENNIRVEYVTGEGGLIGALAAIGLYNKPEEYAKVYYEE
ncbi:methanogenesis marker protein 11 [Methanosphaera sp.]|uniref:methanogenesis marker protein 11 n=1 Tax=Methanosphaera sp. TaxID=2666342 RepID=UPI0025DFD402|nr:methanogenesis marker protein 11 [Methanosphaera sp.]MEE1117137.1 methanogenesis marker protein 11 [Methanosphaera sp.]MEE3324131.1 methanogenesis marker protein 11 [Methanosphaera sp.]MEE3417826.1 methanogenesis marker protein 11 [Methanosphaera sp.]